MDTLILLNDVIAPPVLIGLVLWPFIVGALVLIAVAVLIVNKVRKNKQPEIQPLDEIKEDE